MPHEDRPSKVRYRRLAFCLLAAGWLLPASLMAMYCLADVLGFPQSIQQELLQANVFLFEDNPWLAVLAIIAGLAGFLMLGFSLPAIQRLRPWRVYFLVAGCVTIIAVAGWGFYLDRLPPGHAFHMLTSSLLAPFLAPLAVLGFATGLFGIILLLPIKDA